MRRWGSPPRCPGHPAGDHRGGDHRGVGSRPAPTRRRLPIAALACLWGLAALSGHPAAGQSRAPDPAGLAAARAETGNGTGNNTGGARLQEPTAPRANDSANVSASDSAGDNAGAPVAEGDIEVRPLAVPGPQTAPGPLAAPTGDPAARTSSGDAPRAAPDAGPGDRQDDAQRPPAGPLFGPRPGAPVPTPVAEPEPVSDPVAVLTALWRTAVRARETTLGFEAWLAETLGPEVPARQALPPLPADQAGRTRAIAERWRSRAGPVALGAAGRVVTVFGAALPTAFCAPLTVCYIELEAGEVLTGTPSLGDSVRWQMAVKQQGLDPVTVVIEIKPSEDAGITNLVIPTDRRLYTINLVNDPDIHTPILAFTYPDSAARAAADALAQRDAEAAAARDAQATAAAAAQAIRQAELAQSGLQTDRGLVAAAELDFSFRVEGRAAFRPVRVFADGAKTYIDLPPGFRGALPAIVAGPGEANAALNTRVAENGTRLIADRVITDIYLQSGRVRVRIRRGGT